MSISAGMGPSVLQNSTAVGATFSTSLDSSFFGLAIFLIFLLASIFFF